MAFSPKFARNKPLLSALFLLEALTLMTLGGDVKKHFFMLPNAVFELGLHVYELAIYAYPLRF